MSRKALRFEYRGRPVLVVQNEDHPSEYLWLHLDTRIFFLGVSVGEMKRAAVRRMAVDWLRSHPQHLSTGRAGQA